MIIFALFFTFSDDRQFAVLMDVFQRSMESLSTGVKNIIKMYCATFHVNYNPSDHIDPPRGKYHQSTPRQTCMLCRYAAHSLLSYPVEIFVYAICMLFCIDSCMLRMSKSFKVKAKWSVNNVYYYQIFVRSYPNGSKPCKGSGLIGSCVPLISIYILPHYLLYRFADPTSRYKPLWRTERNPNQFSICTKPKSVF